MPGKLSAIAARDPKGLAVVDSDGALTWTALNRAVNRAVRGIRTVELDGRRIAVISENTCSAIVAYLAGLHAGVSVVPVNFHLKPSEIAFILREGDCGLVLCDAPFATVSAEAARSVGGSIPVVAWGDAGADTRHWEDWLAGLDDEDISLDGVLAQPNLLFTSGTTGFPKGVHRPFDLPDDLEHYLDRLKPGPGASFVAGPLYHTGPQQSLPLLAVGTPLVVQRKFDAEDVLCRIEAHAVATALFVPTHFKRLLALPSDVRDRFDPRSLVRVSHTGSSCPVDVKRTMIDWWGPVFVDAYGSTETGVLCRITSDEWLKHPGSVGRPLPRFTVAVLDDNGAEAQPGSVGTLYFHDREGHGIRYANASDNSTADDRRRPGLFTAGEVGWVDDDGYVYITDRISDMVVSGGVNLYPAEAERVLQQHPAIADVAVIGVPHAEMGEELKALVVPVEGADLDAGEVIAWCRENLTPMKCPRSIELRETLGRTPMGKVNKAALRAPYWSAQ